MALGTRRTPERDNPFLSGLPFRKVTVTTKALTTGGGAVTLTTAEVLGGLLILEVEDNQTATTPTAALLNAAIPGAEVGTAFDLDVINTGDATLTVGLGTGVTIVASSGVDTVLTVGTLASKRFTFVCTGVANPHVPGSTDTWNLYGHGDIAAAVS